MGNHFEYAGGRMVCVTGMYKGINCYDAETLRFIHKVPTSALNSQVISLGRNSVAVGQNRPTHDIEFYDPVSQELKMTIEDVQETDVCAMDCFEPKLDMPTPRLASADGEGNVYVIDTDPEEEGRVLCTFRDGPESPDCLKCVSDGENYSVGGTVYAGGEGMTGSTLRQHAIRHYDVGKDRLTGRYSGHDKRVTSLAYDSENSLLISGSRDSTLKFWSYSGPNSTNMVQSIDTGRSIQSIYLAQDRHLLIVGRMVSIQVYDTRNREEPMSTLSPGKLIGADAFARIDRDLFVGIRDRNVVSFDAEGKVHGTARTSDVNWGVCVMDPLYTDYLAAGAVEKEEEEEGEEGEDEADQASVGDVEG